MDFDVSDAPIDGVGALAAVSISFVVDCVYDVARDTQGGGFVLWERAVDAPFMKNYDDDGERPDRWADRFDISHWGFIEARSNGRLVGGTVIAFRTSTVTMLEGRSDLAVLWDIRVSPEARGQGLGSALLRTAEAWAGARGCRQLKIETQNINVAACRFYARHGYVLKAAHRHAYPNLPDEVQLLWYKDLGAVDTIPVTPRLRL